MADPVVNWTTVPVSSKAPLPLEPFLTHAISAPWSIPRPASKPTRAVMVAPPILTSHDLPDRSVTRCRGPDED